MDRLVALPIAYPTVNLHPYSAHANVTVREIVKSLSPMSSLFCKTEPGKKDFVTYAYSRSGSRSNREYRGGKDQGQTDHRAVHAVLRGDPALETQNRRRQSSITLSM